MVIVKHVWFRCPGYRYEPKGCFAIRWDSQTGQVTISPILGNAPHVQILEAALNAAVPPWRRDEAEELHRRRKHPWTVAVREGMSGARTYMLRVLQNVNLLDAPIEARLHISMYGKLNSEWSLWIGDFAPLFAAVVADYPQAQPVENEPADEDGWFALAPFEAWEGELEFMQLRVSEPAARKFQFNPPGAPARHAVLGRAECLL